MCTRKIMGAVAACAASVCTASPAQDGPWTLRVGAAHVGFSTKADVAVNGATVPGADATASGNATLALELGYDVSPDLRARFLIGVPPTTTLTGTGALAGTGTLGKVQYGPAVLSMTYAFGPSGPVRPYVGAGINYTVVFKSEDGFISHLDAKSAFGSVLEAGFEIPLDRGWSVGLDARKIFLKTQASGTLPAMGGAAASADVRLDPLVILASVGKRF